MGDGTMTYKTMSGMYRAVDRLIGDLGAATISDQRTYDAFNKRCTSLLAELGGLWSNPADVTEAAQAKSRLLDAWHFATN